MIAKMSENITSNFRPYRPALRGTQDNTDLDGKNKGDPSFCLTRLIKETIRHALVIVCVRWSRRGSRLFTRSHRIQQTEASSGQPSPLWRRLPKRLTRLRQPLFP